MADFLFFLMNILSFIAPALYIEIKKPLDYYHNLMSKITEVSKLIAVFSFLFGVLNFFLTIPIDMAEVNDVEKVSKEIKEQTYSLTEKINESKERLILNIYISILNTIVNIIFGIFGSVLYFIIKRSNLLNKL